MNALRDLNNVITDIALELEIVWKYSEPALKQLRNCPFKQNNQSIINNVAGKPQIVSS